MFIDYYLAVFFGLSFSFCVSFVGFLYGSISPARGTVLRYAKVVMSGGGISDETIIRMERQLEKKRIEGQRQYFKAILICTPLSVILSALCFYVYESYSFGYISVFNSLPAIFWACASASLMGAQLSCNLCNPAPDTKRKEMYEMAYACGASSVEVAYFESRLRNVTVLDYHVLREICRQKVDVNI